jgi:uncharacterized protein YceK
MDIRHYLKNIAIALAMLGLVAGCCTVVVTPSHDPNAEQSVQAASDYDIPLDGVRTNRLLE